jgi:hypothetical protein
MHSFIQPACAKYLLCMKGLAKWGIDMESNAVKACSKNNYRVSSDIKQSNHIKINYYVMAVR